MSERFARLKTDPRFRRLKKHAKKVEIDPRFKTLIEDKPGKRAARIDKYGRKVAASHESDTLRRFYRLPEGSQPSVDYARGEGLVESSSEEDEEPETDDEGDVILGGDVNKPISVLEEEVEIDLDESQFAALDAEAEGNLALSERNEANGSTTKSTKRLAAVNLDWDHVKASHLFKIFASQLTLTTSGENNSTASRGRLLHVRIYPSEFGKKRMAEEDKTGPPAELFRNPKASRNEESDEDEDEDRKPHTGEDYDQDALRRYQLERLRYYYAIATFDSLNAAAHVYTELEGTELERSANLFDLSYVPEDMKFDEKPHDEATHDTISYQLLDFTTDALRHSNVKLTWDDDDPERVRVTRRNLSKKEIDEMDFKILIASSDEEEEEDAMGTKDAQALRALLLSGNDENLPEGWGGSSRDKGGEMEITFTPGLSENPKEGTKKAQNEKEFETTLERYQRKEKEKKKAKKAAREEARNTQTEKDRPKTQSKTPKLDDEFFAEDTEEEENDIDISKEQTKGKEDKGRKAKHEKKKKIVDENPTAATEAELSLLLDVDSNAKHFDMPSIMRAERKAEKSGKQKKRKRDGKGEENKERDEDNVEINLADPRFKNLHEDHRFAIDPSNPHFKKTKSMKKLLQAKGGRTGDETVEREGKRRRRE